MSYIIPSVLVYQQLANAGGVLNSTPDLDTCIIGPSYNVLKYVSGSAASQVATAALSTSTTLADTTVDSAVLTNVVAPGGFAVGDSVLVIGAGANGANLQATILSMAGNQITLDTGASTAVTGAVLSKAGKIANTAVTNTFALPGQKPGQAVTTSTVVPWYNNTKVETFLNGAYSYSGQSTLTVNTPTGVTGTINAASNSLAISTAAMATQWAIGDDISVANAGAGGTVPLVTKISNISGQTFTLAAAAVTTATTQAVTKPLVSNQNATTNTLRIEAGDSVVVTYTPPGGTATTMSSKVRSVVTSSGQNGTVSTITLYDAPPDNLSVPTTTGTVGAASTALTVASAAGFATGDTVVVSGAGAAGASLTTTITVSGLTFTLGAAATTAVTNAVVTKVIASTGTVSPGATAVTVTTGGGTHFQTGDRIILEGAGANGADHLATLTNVATNTLTFAGNPTVTSVSAGAKVRRVNNVQLSVRKTYNNQQVAATKPISGGSNFDTSTTASTGQVTIQANSELIYGKVITADVYFSYKALRTDLAGTINTFESIDDVEGLLGDTTDDNPLALALVMALANTTGRIFAIGIKSNDLQGHLDALTLTETQRLYTLVPLTQDQSIIASYKAHVDQMSLPAAASWRVVLANTAIPTTQNIGNYSSTSVNANSGNNTVTINTGNYVLTASNATFVQDGVTPGDVVNITAATPGTIIGTATVLQVVSNQQLIISALATATAVSYYVTRALTKSQQATAVAGVSSQFNDKRIVHVQPDTVGVTVNGATKFLPGYYLCSALGGMMAGFPVQQGFTNIGVAGIVDLKNSNFYFSRADLGTMAEVGTFLFVQETQGGIPYVRHEMTTDVSVLEYREVLKVKNWDFLSYFYYDKLKMFIGSWNVTADTLNTIRQTIDASSELLKGQKLPKIGPPLISGVITKLEQDANNKDQVNCNLQIEIVSPLNYLNLYLIV